MPAGLQTCRHSLIAAFKRHAAQHLLTAEHDTRLTEQMIVEACRVVCGVAIHFGAGVGFNFPPTVPSMNVLHADFRLPEWSPKLEQVEKVFQLSHIQIQETCTLLRRDRAHEPQREVRDPQRDLAPIAAVAVVPHRLKHLRAIGGGRPTWGHLKLLLRKHVCMCRHAHQKHEERKDGNNTLSHCVTLSC